jgi:hypothetical protein
MCGDLAKTPKFSEISALKSLRKKWQMNQSRPSVGFQFKAQSAAASQIPTREAPDGLPYCDAEFDRQSALPFS